MTLHAHGCRSAVTCQGPSFETVRAGYGGGYSFKHSFCAPPGIREYEGRLFEEQESEYD